MTDNANRAVIFVGGTSYSGSTLLDMTLANDPAGLSVGEVFAVFYPFRRHHLRLESLGTTIDWRALKSAGPKHLYRNLFDQFPECRFIVDSSKSPLWISERSAELKEIGIRAENVLIWKSPNEFLSSRRKRGRERGWQKEWINYHRYYFTLIDAWRSVKYRDFVTDGTTLPRLCATLGIPYFADKGQYWDRGQLTVFGNDAARIHLHDSSSTEYARVKSLISSSTNLSRQFQHRALFYEKPDESSSRHDEGIFRSIVETIERGDVSMEASRVQPLPLTIEGLRTSGFYHGYQVAKQRYGLKWILDALRH